MSAGLAQVFWLGGSPSAGKSTVAGRIAHRFGYLIYDCDEAWERRGVTASVDEEPTLYRLASATPEQVWLRRPIAQQVRDAISSYGELFPLILDDLEDMTGDTPVIAVGAALMPLLVIGSVVPARRAL